MKAVLIAVFAVLAVATAQRSVEATFRNEFDSELQLSTSTLKYGAFVAKPVATIGVSADWVSIFKVTGDSISGTVTYVLPNTRVHVTMNFEDTAANSNYTAAVGPSPFIGGVFGVTGNATAVVQYWCHEECKGKGC